MVRQTGSSIFTTRTLLVDMVCCTFASQVLMTFEGAKAGGLRREPDVVSKGTLRRGDKIHRSDLGFGESQVVQWI